MSAWEKEILKNNKIFETSGATEVRISPRGSSDTVWTNARGGEGKKPEGVGEDISGNKIKGDGAPEGNHNFSNKNKTTNEEDYRVTCKIHNNSITAVNGAECVGMANFHNTKLMTNASQGQGGREGREDFPNPNPSGIRHNICSNNISADGSAKVGLHNFGNTLLMAKNFPTGDDRQPPEKIRLVPGRLIQKQERGGTLDIRKNEITATNATGVGMFNFNNMTDYTGQGRPTVTGNGRSIRGNKITANGGKDVGISNFDNRKCGGKKSPA